MTIQHVILLLRRSVLCSYRRKSINIYFGATYMLLLILICALCFANAMLLKDRPVVVKIVAKLKDILLKVLMFLHLK